MHPHITSGLTRARDADLARAAAGQSVAREARLLRRHHRRAAADARRAWTPADAAALAAITGRTAPPPARLTDRVRVAVRVLVAR
ncbi:MAG: hypothetical protein ACJ76K_19170 [Solirubrobacteraceae bacterium]